MLYFNQPKFWYQSPSSILQSLNKLCSFFYHRHWRQEYKHKAQIPVIAIGGVSVGGAGKTPSAIFLAKLLEENGIKPMVGLRGYGRKKNTTILVDPQKHSFSDVGDEALLLSKRVATAVSSNRRDLEQIALSKGYNCLILDDGWAQRDLYVDLKILVIDGKQSLGNQLLFPLGPLRFPIEYAINQADIIFFLDSDKFGILDQITFKDKILNLKSQYDFSNISKNVVLFSGLGCNQKFFDTFIDFNIIKTFAFPDHYPYTESDISKIILYTEAEAAKLHTTIDIITTEKDFYRIPANNKNKIKTLPLSLINTNYILNNFVSILKKNIIQL